MKKVIIIGAGPAGITAGYELVKRSDRFEVEILEESADIGGISKTVYYHGNRMDIGGHRFFSKNAQVMKWWEDLMPLQGEPAYDDRELGREVALAKGGPDPEKEDIVMLKRKRISRIYYKKKFFDYPVEINWNTIKNMGVGTTFLAGVDYLISAVHKRKENSLEDFYMNRFGSRLYHMFFEGYTKKLWGRHPSEISPDWGAQRVKGLSILGVLKDNLQKLLHLKRKEVETSLIEEFYYPKYGPGQLWEHAMECYLKAGGKLEKECRVTEILEEEGRVCGVICTKDGKQYRKEADYVLSSMPLKDLAAGMKSMPERERKIAEGLPYRDFVTVGVLVDKLAIKNKTKDRTLHGGVPDCWIYVQDTGVDMGRIQIFNNWSPYLVERPGDTIWLGLEYFCKEGDANWEKTEDEWKELAESELKRMGILAPETRILDYHCEKVKKAYPAYFDTYKDISTLITWLNSIPNLFCIGRNGQHRYNNMDHSMMTAFEAVENILSGRENKDNVWNVNTEKNYHEQKL